MRDNYTKHSLWIVAGLGPVISNCESPSGQGVIFRSPWTFFVMALNKRCNQNRNYLDDASHLDYNTHTTAKEDDHRLNEMIVHSDRKVKSLWIQNNVIQTMG